MKTDEQRGNAGLVIRLMRSHWNGSRAAFASVETADGHPRGIDSAVGTPSLFVSGPSSSFAPCSGGRQHSNLGGVGEARR